MQRLRDQNAAKGTGDEIDQHCYRDDDANAWKIEPNSRHHSGDEAESSPVHGADQNLAQDHAGSIGAGEFARRQCAHGPES